ncbi:MAG: L-aspartate oxidase, partial [Gemmatimonadetes bacterium]
LSTDVLVIGSGMAGLTFALDVADPLHVLLVTKKARAESNTNWAKGGIAAALGPDDSPELHVADTLAVGGGLCRVEAVELLAREGPERVRELMARGAAFDLEGGALSLGREGGHSRRRIARTGDHTGRTVEAALLDAVARSPYIRVVEDHLAIDLTVDEGAGGRHCTGALVLEHHAGELVHIEAAAVVLATGGCGQVYRHTTNPAIATGDGIAMAYRAGARVGNMEFIQFHPTALYPTEDPAFLISEALRGEGAVLRRMDGTPFMDDYDPRGSLAPRDVVARAIDRELKRTGDPHVVLDTSPIPPEVLEQRFPDAVAGCRARGCEPTEGIPVVPAAHYVCGGVFTDNDARTTLPGLWAAGEVACTGVHGANRLASNSLVEAVVFAHRGALAVREELSAGRDDTALGEDGGRARGGLPEEGAESAAAGAGRSAAPSTAPESPEGEREARIAETRARLRASMWDLVG